MKRFISFLAFSFVVIFAHAQAPAGYYDSANGLTGAPLKTALKNIITTGHTPGSYSDLWIAYQTTDRDYYYENDGTILDIYSEKPTTSDPYNFNIGTNQCGSYNSEGDCYNREHIVPQSLFNDALPMVSDVHFIRATDGYVNNIRSNYPFGVVGTANYTSQNGSKRGTSASTGYTGTVFEPIDAFKGDVARMIFYFVTRYESQLSTFTSGDMLGSSAYPGLQTWELNQLLIWHNADPVSAAEIARNNASYTFQGNRNPFIDNPTYANAIWGTPTTDTQAPTAPTNLASTGATSNSVSLSWTASTDNIGVTGYNVYVNGTLYTTVTGTTATVSGLTASTTYTFYVIAKDAANNLSSQSNTVTETTTAVSSGGSCGTETFETIPANDSQYTTRSWTNNAITWTATAARTDQTINGRAIMVRTGNLTSSTIANGVGSLTLTTQLKFSDSPGNLTVQVNGNTVGTIPYSSAAQTTTISNINVSGNAIISIVNTTSNRVAMDDLTWTCTASLSTNDVVKTKDDYQIYPNPVKNHLVFIKGENLDQIKTAEIYNLNGARVKKINKPFVHSNYLEVRELEKGVYILKTDKFTTKFIIE